jgi:hypothetical protein
MSAIKTILKLTPLHCVVKVSDAGSQTISLATDLKWGNTAAGQQEVPNGGGTGLCTVNIVGITFSIPGATAGTVIRNGVHVFDVLGSFQFHFNGFSDTIQNESDIAVTIPAGGGQIILELVKIAGYGNDQQINTQPQL